MKIKFIEATSGKSSDDPNTFNWGKFLLCQFEAEEWKYQSAVPIPDDLMRAMGGKRRPLLSEIGFNPRQFWLFDLQTCEGAAFVPSGLAHIDMKEKHQVWVCLLYEPLLEWLYTQDLTDINKLPSVVYLPHAKTGLYGYRRKGPDDKERRKILRSCEPVSQEDEV